MTLDKDDIQALVLALAPLVTTRQIDEFVHNDICMDLGRIYRTQGKKAFVEALQEQNRSRIESYRKRGIVI